MGTFVMVCVCFEECVCVTECLSSRRACAVAVERLSTVMGSTTAWEPLYQGVESADTTRVPECAERLMVVIAGIRGVCMCTGSVCVCVCGGGMLCCVCGHPQMFSLPPSDRYQALPSILHRVDFLNVQIHLLLEFHLDLASAVERAYSTPTAPTYLAYLNAAQYISSVLQQWGEEAVRHASFTPHTVVLVCVLHILGMQAVE